MQPGLKKDSHCTSRFHAVEINGSVVLDRDSNLLAFGAILRHRPPLDQDEEVGGAAGQRQQSAPLQFGAVLMVSEGGRLSFHQKSHCIWAL